MHSKARDKCQCFTQDATPLDVSRDMCMRVVKDGIFLDWQDPSAGHTQTAFDEPQPAPQQVYHQPLAQPPAADRPLGYAERLAARNASVSSVFGQ